MHKDTYTTANPYTDNGYSSRADYLAELCDEYPADVVHTLADMLGETEDFDGLVTMLEDYSETEADNADDADDAVRTWRAAAAMRALATDTDAARDAAAVRAAREALAEAYAKAGAALDAARATYHDALKAYTDSVAACHAATYAADDARAALNAAD